MLTKFLRHRRYKKMIKVSSSHILEEFAKIISEIIERLEKENRIKASKYREVLKFELMALILWFFQKSDIFSETWHKLLLDEVHNQYYLRLKKHGYTFEMRQVVCDDFNLRNKIYTETLNKEVDLAMVSTQFMNFLSKNSKTNLNIQEMTTIMLLLTEKLDGRFKEWSEAMRN